MPDATADESSPSVKVTLEAIYDTVLSIDKKVDPIPAQIRDHEQRIRALERHGWMWLGAAAVGGGAFTEIISRAFGG